MPPKSQRKQTAPVAPTTNADNEQQQTDNSESSEEETGEYRSWNPDQLEIEILDNPYHELELMDWWKFPPVAVKGIICQTAGA